MYNFGGKKIRLQTERSTDFQVHSIEICSWEMCHDKNSFDTIIRRIDLHTLFHPFIFKEEKQSKMSFDVIHHHYVSIWNEITSAKILASIQNALYRRHSAASAKKKNIERLCFRLTMKSHEQAKLKYPCMYRASYCNWDIAVNPWANTQKEFLFCDDATSFVPKFFLIRFMT